MGMGGHGHVYMDLFGGVLVYKYDTLVRSIIEYWLEKSLWLGSGKYVKCRICEPDAPIRLAGQQKPTRGSCWPDPEMNRFSWVMTWPDP